MKVNQYDYPKERNNCKNGKNYFESLNVSGVTWVCLLKYL